MQKPGWVRGNKTEAIFNKWQEKPNSRPLSIKVKCLDCVGGDMTEIKRCQIKDCSLWAVRPYKTDEEKAHRRLERIESGCSLKLKGFAIKKGESK